MQEKSGKQKSEKRNKRLLASGVTIFIIAISILAYLSWRNNSSTSHVPVQDSSTYFAISGLAGTYIPTGSNSTPDNPGNSVLMKTFGFYFTPVRGDATNVRIFATGYVDPLNTNFEGQTIRNGTTTFAELDPQFEIPVQKGTDGTYDLTIRIASEEADGNIILHFTANELFVA